MVVKDTLQGYPDEFQIFFKTANNNHLFKYNFSDIFQAFGYFKNLFSKSKLKLRLLEW